MRKIVPLQGYVIAKKTSELQSIDTEMSEVQGMKFLVVDKSASRNDAVGNKTRVRLFHIESVSDLADDTTKSFVGKNMYCICMEKEDSNNVIIDKDSGEKLFIIPESDVLAELRETND